jgi:hypothetical protein
MGTMMRRIPGTASWNIFQDGSLSGTVRQAPDGSWFADAGGLAPPTQAGTRKDAARQLTGGL